MCRRSGYLDLIVEADRFRLLEGADALTEYRFNTGTARHLFCWCAVSSRSTSRVPTPMVGASTCAASTRQPSAASTCVRSTAIVGNRASMDFEVSRER